ncbi:MAG: ThuA domain-containing protein, partial [Bacteroidia bacterium]|nr:ThuA domain-containing protein [Bacteroidia bacterium]
MQKLTLFTLISILLLGFGCDKKRDEIRLLVFSKTAGYRHQSIGAGQQAIFKMAEEQGWKIDTTEEATAFTEENLQKYSTVVFLNTTGDILNVAQQRDFERYIQSGGGFVGIHAASDTEYDWPWYGRLVGAYFNGHPNNPNVREADMKIVKKDHPSTAHFGGDVWHRSDEFYNFKKIYDNPADGIVPLVEIDETTYEGGTNGDFHPMSWYHDFDGGRAWYSNFGHTDETFSEEA